MKNKKVEEAPSDRVMDSFSLDSLLRDHTINFAHPPATECFYLLVTAGRPPHHSAHQRI